MFLLYEGKVGEERRNEYSFACRAYTNKRTTTICDAEKKLLTIVTPYPNQSAVIASQPATMTPAVAIMGYGFIRQPCKTLATPTYPLL